ncbi:MAG: NAD(+)/NADH kinase [Desulfobacterales bacterium]|nr:NAD(+)/NADH kinase [Desulfobacterales bacterium]
MKKIGLVIKKDADACRRADELQSWLRSAQIEVVRNETLPPTRASSAPADLDAVVVLGGDGTFLSAVRWVGDLGIPLLGIKFGEVGFLAEIVEDHLFEAARRLLDRQFVIRPRMRLEVTVTRDGRQLVRETVLNDVVINRGALARLADIETHIDDYYLTTYRADGLIVATPTGSTAYSLAAGGPILHPAVPAIIMTPICPFTLTNRPLIVPDSATITLRLAKKSTDIRLTLDGQSGLEITDQDEIRVCKGRHPVNMISFPEQQYFDLLKAKLRWSGGRV